MKVSKATVIVFLIMNISSCQSTQSVDMYFQKNDQIIDTDVTVDVLADFICMNFIYCNEIQLNFEFEIENTDIVSIVGNNTMSFTKDDYVVTNKTTEEVQIKNISIPLRGEFLGKTVLRVKLLGGKVSSSVWIYKISVKRGASEVATLERVFTGCLFILMVITQTTFGCELDLHMVKGYLKKPIGALCGMLFQYGVLPGIAVGLGYLLKLENTIAFGLLLIGCSPGGGASNFYSTVLGGDINLSIVMTFLSNIAALGMMPLWIYTAGARILNGPVKIPFVNMFIILLSLVIPTSIGLLLKYKKPTMAKKFVKYGRPILLLIILPCVAVGIYTKLYLIELLGKSEWQLIVGCVSLPIVAMIASVLFSWLIARRSVKEVKTIGIEVGVQNSAVPLIILGASMSQPDSDISAVPSMIATITVNVFLMTLSISQIIHKKCSARRAQKETISGQSQEKETFHSLNGNATAIPTLNKHGNLDLYPGELNEKNPNLLTTYI